MSHAESACASAAAHGARAAAADASQPGPSVAASEAAAATAAALAASSSDRATPQAARSSAIRASYAARTVAFGRFSAWTAAKPRRRDCRKFRKARTAFRISSAMACKGGRVGELRLLPGRCSPFLPCLVCGQGNAAEGKHEN